MEIYAHRGWHGPGAPENTMEAFRRAANFGVGIETDLRTDKDGRIILFHDRAVAEVPVHEIDRDELARRVGYAVPLLDEFLAAGFNVPFNLELKSKAAWARLQPYLDQGLDDRVLLSSFSHAIAFDAGARFHRDAALLFAKLPAEADRPLPKPHVRHLVWDIAIVDRPLLAEMADRGFENLVYGACTEAEHGNLVAMGCDGIITDFPDIALSACEHRSSGD